MGRRRYLVRGSERVQTRGVRITKVCGSEGKGKGQNFKAGKTKGERREGGESMRGWARYIGRAATEPQQRIPTRDQSERSGTEAWWASETGVLVPVIIREPLIMRRFAGDEGLSLDFVQCAPFDNLRSSCLARVQGGPALLLGRLSA